MRDTVWSTILLLSRKVSGKSVTVLQSSVIYDAFRQLLHLSSQPSLLISAMWPLIPETFWDSSGVNKQNSVLSESPLSLPTLPAGRWLLTYMFFVGSFVIFSSPPHPVFHLYILRLLQMAVFSWWCSLSVFISSCCFVGIILKGVRETLYIIFSECYFE